MSVPTNYNYSFTVKANPNQINPSILRLVKCIAEGEPGSEVYGEVTLDESQFNEFRSDLKNQGIVLCNIKRIWNVTEESVP